MQDMLSQLGGLFLQTVPTVLIIFILYFILRGLFFQPLLEVMAERDARTKGAEKAATEAKTAAEGKIAEYQAALNKARAQVYGEQEAARKKLLEERAEQLKEARGKAAAEVTAAKTRLTSELAMARGEVEATVSQLSAEIVRRILQVPPRPGAPVREAR